MYRSARPLNLSCARARTVSTICLCSAVSLNSMNDPLYALLAGIRDIHQPRSIVSGLQGVAQRFRCPAAQPTCAVSLWRFFVDQPRDSPQRKLIASRLWTLEMWISITGASNVFNASRIATDVWVNAAGLITRPPAVSRAS